MGASPRLHYTSSYVLRVAAAAQSVGPYGRVIGVDMTDNQIAVARQYEDWHRDRFGYATSNVEFHHGQIEDLASVGIQVIDNSLATITA